MSYLGDFVHHCHVWLLSGANTDHARQHLRDRGFTGEDVRDLVVGWAPEINVRSFDQTFEFYNCLIFPNFDDDGTPYAITIQEIKP